MQILSQSKVVINKYNLIFGRLDKKCTLSTATDYKREMNIWDEIEIILQDDTTSLSEKNSELKALKTIIRRVPDTREFTLDESTLKLIIRYVSDHDPNLLAGISQEIEETEAWQSLQRETVFCDSQTLVLFIITCTPDFSSILLFAFF